MASKSDGDSLDEITEAAQTTAKGRETGFLKLFKPFASRFGRLFGGR